MRKVFRKLLCWIGIHKKEKLKIELANGKMYCTTKYKGEDSYVLNYDVCKYCNKDNPYITGEW